MYKVELLRGHQIMANHNFKVLSYSTEQLSSHLSEGGCPEFYQIQFLLLFCIEIHQSYGIALKYIYSPTYPQIGYWKKLRYVKHV